jgi:hypothetical protein
MKITELKEGIASYIKCHQSVAGYNFQEKKMTFEKSEGDFRNVIRFAFVKWTNAIQIQVFIDIQFLPFTKSLIGGIGNKWIFSPELNEIGKNGDFSIRDLQFRWQWVTSATDIPNVMDVIFTCLHERGLPFINHVNSVDNLIKLFVDEIEEPSFLTIDSYNYLFSLFLASQYKIESLEKVKIYTDLKIKSVRSADLVNDYTRYRDSITLRTPLGSNLKRLPKTCFD